MNYKNTVYQYKWISLIYKFNLINVSDLFVTILYNDVIYTKNSLTDCRKLT